MFNRVAITYYARIDVSQNDTANISGGAPKSLFWKWFPVVLTVEVAPCGQLTALRKPATTKSQYLAGHDEDPERAHSPGILTMTSRLRKSSLDAGLNRRTVFFAASHHCWARQRLGRANSPRCARLSVVRSSMGGLARNRGHLPIYM